MNTRIDNTLPAIGSIAARFTPLLMLLAMLLAGCQGEAPQAEPRTQFAVTTSWLEAALKDIAGEATPVYRLCPPGTCPGHFDISPGGVEQLRRSRALVLFDFQRALDEKLAASLQPQLRILPIEARPGLCLPESYLAACAALQSALAEDEPEHATRYQAALEATRARLTQLEARLRGGIEAAGLVGAKVVASGHQNVFCRWLGLDVVAVYSGGESATPAKLEELIQAGREAGVRFVIGNQQEGRQSAEALAWQLGAPVVTFSNFPTLQPGQATFDELLAFNVGELLAAARVPATAPANAP